MTLTKTPICNFGEKAKDFNLLSTENKKISLMCFETLSSTEWGSVAFKPNVYTDISDYIEEKIEAFLKYQTENKKYPHPRSPAGIKIWAKQRGVEICVEYAEAFILVREVR